MPGVRHWFFRFRTRLASGGCLAASVCRHARWVGMLYCWLLRPLLGFPLWGGPAAGGGVSARCRGPPISSVASTVGSLRCGWVGVAGCVVASPVSRAGSLAWPSDTGGTPGRLPGPADRGVSAGTVACAGSGSEAGPGLGAQRLGDDDSVGRTAGPAGGAPCPWGACSACAGACRWSPWAAALGVAGARGWGLLVGLLAWGHTVQEGRVLVVSVGVVVRVCVGGPSRGAYAGPFVGRSGVRWRGRGSGWACFAAAWLAAGWDRVWTRRVMFGVVEPGFLWGPGLGTYAGVQWQGGARVGCLLPSYS